MPTIRLAGVRIVQLDLCIINTPSVVEQIFAYFDCNQGIVTKNSTLEVQINLYNADHLQCCLLVKPIFISPNAGYCILDNEELGQLGVGRRLDKKSRYPIDFLVLHTFI